jgi:hypothetical protein
MSLLLFLNSVDFEFPASGACPEGFLFLLPPGHRAEGTALPIAFIGDPKKDFTHSSTDWSDRVFTSPVFLSFESMHRITLPI